MLTWCRLPRFQENSPTSVASPSIPAGWEQFAGEGWEGITQEHIVRSAVGGYKQVGNKILSTNIFADPDIMTDPWSIFNWTPSRPGIFNIAVFWDPDNKFVSSINSKKGRQYPCEAGMYPSPFEVEDPSLTPQQRMEKGAKDQAEFFDQSGLSMSEDLREGCDHHHTKSHKKKNQNDRQRCEGTGILLTQYYKRTDVSKINKHEHVTHAMHNCKVQPGDATLVGKNQCEKGKC